MMPLPTFVGCQVTPMQDKPPFLTRRRFLGGALILAAVPALGACRRDDARLYGRYYSVPQCFSLVRQEIFPASSL